MKCIRMEASHGQGQDARLWRTRLAVTGSAYQVGLGVSWAVNDNISLRLAAERHWVDFKNQGAPYLDQFKVGMAWRFL